MVKKSFVLALSILVLGLVLSSLVSANYVAPCSLDSEDYDYIAHIGWELRSDGILRYETKAFDFSETVPAGKYSVTLVASDGYPGRTSQPHEQFYASFLNGNKVVSNSSSTDDLEDNVEQAVLEQVVDNVLVFPEDVDSVKAVHSAYLDKSSPNSLNAVCVGLKKVEDEERDERKLKKTPVILDVCEPNWECSGWSECSNGVMTRNCEDSNFCKIEDSYNKPLEQSGCGVSAKVYAEDNSYYLLIFVGIILLLILLIILVNLFK